MKEKIVLAVALIALHIFFTNYNEMTYITGLLHLSMIALIFSTLYIVRRINKPNYVKALQIAYFSILIIFNILFVMGMYLFFTVIVVYIGTIVIFMKKILKLTAPSIEAIDGHNLHLAVSQYNAWIIMCLTFDLIVKMIGA